MPIPSIPIVFLAFSNDEHRHLASLTQERTAILNLFEPLVSQNKCELVIEAAATADDIFRIFSKRKYRNRIVAFHYAGHADGNGIHTISEKGGNKTTYASGLAKLFGMQENLKLVFLNGCSTEGQVKALQANDIPNIIATSKSVEDTVAKNLAIQFYNAFVENQSIEEAFTTACSRIEADYGEGNFRRIGNTARPEPGPPWKNYFKSGTWRLENFRPINKPFKIFLAYSFYDENEKKKLDRQLAILKRRKLIDVFSKTEIREGSVSEDVIIKHLNEANIVLLFVTENLFYDDESMKLIDEAVERYERDAVTLIPVYINRCLIEGEKFTQLEPLPRRHLHNGQIWQFVNDWDNEDKAYYEIALGLRNLIMSLKQENQ